MRALFVSNLYPPQVIGGYEVLCEGAVEHMRAAGHEVEVITARGEPGGQHNVPQPHVRRELTLHLQEGRLQHPHPLRRLAAERRDNRALRAIADWDVAVVFGMAGLAKSLLAQLHERGPVLYVLADSWPAWDLATDTWLGRLHPEGPPGTPLGVRRLRFPSLAARAVVPLARRAGVPCEWPDPYGRGRWLAGSYWLADELLGRAKLPIRDCRVVHMGLPLELFPRRTEDPGGRRLLYVGRVTPQKGIDVALRALGRMDDRATLTLVGPVDPGYLQEPPPRATLAGSVPRVELAGVYAAHDVCVFPVTWDEPFGLVPLEAMAVGVPVVATGTGGSAEFLEHERNCLIVSPGSDAELADAVTRLLGDSALRARLAEGGRATAERFSVERMGQSVMEAAAELVRGAPASVGSPVSARPGRTSA